MKAQFGTVIYVVIGIIMVGFLLGAFTPSVDTVRTNALATTTDPLQKIELFFLIPFIWIIWLIISVFALAAATR